MTISSDQTLQSIIDSDKAIADRGLPKRGKVFSVIPEQESVTVENLGTAGTQKMVIRHPYMGVNSWMRVMPEQGTTVLTQRRGDYAQTDIFGYISSALPNLVQRAVTSDAFIYRVLDEGEMEIMSSGRAYTHWGADGNLSLRGGLVKQDLSQTDLELSQTAPTFSRRLHLNSYSSLGHEERFGVVKRPNSTNSNSMQDYVQTTAVGGPMPTTVAATAAATAGTAEYAVEYSRWLNKKNGTALTSIQEGHVVNASGGFDKQASTNKYLRYRKEIFHRVAGNLSLEVDEDLNVLLNNVNTAREFKMNLGALSALDITSKSFKGTFTTTGTMSFTQSLRISSAKVDVASPLVNFGSNPLFSLIVGETFQGSVMAPLINLISAALTALAATPTLTPVTQTILANLVPSISVIQAAMPATLTQMVKVSG